MQADSLSQRTGNQNSYISNNLDNSRVQGKNQSGLQLAPQQVELEMNSVQVSSEQVYVYKYSEVFTSAELTSNNLADVKVLKKLVAASMNTRLRIKQIREHPLLSPEPWSGSEGQPGQEQTEAAFNPDMPVRGSRLKYFAFFSVQERPPPSE